MQKIKQILSVILISIGVIGSISVAHAELRIDVSGSHSEPLPFAMPNLFNPDGSRSSFGADITEVVVADLERTGLIRYINPEAYIQRFN